MTKPHTTTKGLRLIDQAWIDLQEILQRKSREWFEALVAKEAAKLRSKK